MKNRIFLCSILLIIQTATMAQDIHFSQYYNIPLVVNPALTGAFNGDQRVNINYKDQWKSIGSPYRTYALSFDAAMMKKKWKNAFLGGGLLLYKDMAGSAEMGTTQIGLSLSSFISVSENQKISAGIQGGYAQRSLTLDNQTWDEMYCAACPSGFDPSIQQSEGIQSFNDFGFGDFTAGLQWAYTTGDATLSSHDRQSINAGIAFHHVNRPAQKFNFNDEEVDKLYSRIAAHAGAIFGIKNTGLELVPSILFLQQGPARELDLGSMIRYTVREGSKYTGIYQEIAVSIGGFARAKDAIIPALQIEYANYTLGITYDVNTSSLKPATAGKGGVEIMLRYVNPNPFRNIKSSVRFL